jgi:hypothetical protein
MSKACLTLHSIGGILNYTVFRVCFEREDNMQDVNVQLLLSKSPIFDMRRLLLTQLAHLSTLVR